MENVENAVVAANSIQISSLETIKAEGKGILFINANRYVAVSSENVKGKMASLKVYGVLTPFQMIPANFASEEGLDLVDENGTLVTDVERISNSFCILDGNNRYRARLEISRKADLARSKGKMLDVGKALDDVTVMIHQTKPAKGVLSSLMEINTTNVKWKYGDYASTALKLNPNSDILKCIVELRDKHGFSPSSISLYLTFNAKHIKEEHIANAIKSNELEPAYFGKVQLERANKILSTLRDAGFENKVIKKKYLIEFLIENADKLEDMLKAISRLTEPEVKAISDNLGKSDDAFNPIISKL